MKLYLQAALFIIVGGVAGAAYNAALGSYILTTLVAAVPVEAPGVRTPGEPDTAYAVSGPPTAYAVGMPVATPFIGPVSFKTPVTLPTPRPTISIPSPAPDRKPEVSPFAPPSRSARGD